MALLKKLNSEYMAIHKAKEDAFWSMKMDLEHYKEGSFEEAETNFIKFIGNSAPIKDIKLELERTDLPADKTTGLRGWLRFFECNAVENPAAQKIQEELIQLEGNLFRKRQELKLGFIHPETGEWEASNYGKLSLQMQTAENPKIREAAWRAQGKIESHILENGFIEIVKKRNELGRLLGYEDYYDYKVSLNEGFNKKKLFSILDELVKSTEVTYRKYVDSVVAEHGPKALKPWNFNHLTSGDLTTQLDPYFPFEHALDRWVQSFAALGIKYNHAELKLDLVHRTGKYENGFMHGPVPGFLSEGEHTTAAINFTANAIPGEIGSGLRATTTLFHEGGHAAHFANIMMPAPCFAQEFAPTSVAFAETQSMFLDSLIDDPDWLVRYAKTIDGKAMPIDLLKKKITLSHLKTPGMLRNMMSVCYTEKAIYEMTDDEISAEKIMAATRQIEQKLSFLEAGARPVLSIPHLISGEASAYYHGYILAQMGVFQTRAYFIEKYGYIMDNPEIGPELAATYWLEGNAKNFLEFIQSMTGKPFSAMATADVVNQSLEDCLKEMEASIAREKEQPHFSGEVDLNADISMVHGDKVIASTETSSYKDLTRKYAEWINKPENWQ